MVGRPQPSPSSPADGKPFPPLPLSYRAALATPLAVAPGHTRAYVVAVPPPTDPHVPSAGTDDRQQQFPLSRSCSNPGRLDPSATALTPPLPSSPAPLADPAFPHTRPPTPFHPLSAGAALAPHGSAPAIAVLSPGFPSSALSMPDAALLRSQLLAPGFPHVLPDMTVGAPCVPTHHR